MRSQRERAARPQQGGPALLAWRLAAASGVVGFYLSGAAVDVALPAEGEDFSLGRFTLAAVGAAVFAVAGAYADLAIGRRRRRSGEAARRRKPRAGR